MTMGRLPEIRVTRRGRMIDRVEWDPCRDGEPLFDITGMHVLRVESQIELDGSVPAVKVTLMARIVEVEEDMPFGASSRPGADG